MAQKSKNNKKESTKKKEIHEKNGENLSTEIDKEKAENLQLTNIEMSNSVTTDKNGVSIQCITIIGQIEGHYAAQDGQKVTKYEQLIPLLVSFEESDNVDGLLIILNTVGGDVEAGLALAELIAGMKKPTASLVLGGGHSIGVPLAVSAKKSFIVPSATMTVHPVRTNGLVISSPQTYRYFERMQDRILRFVAQHSNVGIEKLKEMLYAREEMSNDIGTILDGEQAVKCGLIDSVGSLADAISYLHEEVERL